jgi:hypothetical protein
MIREGQILLVWNLFSIFQLLAEIPTAKIWAEVKASQKTNT